MPVARMSREQIAAMFPNASRSLFEANTALSLTPTIGGSKKCPVWSSAEDTALRACISARKTSTEISRMMGRTRHAINCRVHELRLKRPRKPFVYVSEAKWTPEERRRKASERLKERHATHGHPMKDRPVPNSVREKISAANQGRLVPPERTLRSLKTRFAKNGTLALFNDANRKWKAGWREIGGQRIYARSRWEANYARYLEFQRIAGLISKWEHEPETFWFEKIRRGCRSFLIDFRVTINDGTVEYHEVKGWMDARSKTKIRRMAKYYPEIILVVRDASWFRSNRLKLRSLIAGWEDGSK